LREQDARFVLALQEKGCRVFFRKTPAFQAPVDARSLVRAAAARHGTSTVYEAALDWRLVPGFLPGHERSFGIAVVVSDFDGKTRRTAEYGGGVLPRRRPSEFAALRLGGVR
jgi:hypothetical protein